ncbi:TPA: hypothetical protein ACHIDG_004761 [Escherichia coli]
MINKYKVFILLCLLLCAQKTIANYSALPSNQRLDVSKSIPYETNSPGGWVNVGELPINTGGDYHIGSDNDYNMCLLARYLCTSGSISLGHTGQANYTIYITRRFAEIKDESGGNYTLTVGFPDGPPVVGLYENIRNWDEHNTPLTFNGSLSAPGKDFDYLSAHVSGTATEWCGSIVGCEYWMGAYIHNNTGMPSLYIKLPKNLKTHSISFNDVEILSLELSMGNKAHDTVTPVSAKLYISGTIVVPQRCYIKADNTSFEVGKISPNGINGLIKDVSTSVTTTCYSAPEGTQQYLKMAPVSGGKLSYDNLRYYIDNDSAIGFIFNISRMLDCNSVSDNNNRFNSEYFMRQINSSKQAVFSDRINFGLCKYGVPSITGEKTVILRLTSRWVVN